MTSEPPLNESPRSCEDTQIRSDQNSTPSSDKKYVTVATDDVTDIAEKDESRSESNTSSSLRQSTEELPNNGTVLSEKSNVSVGLGDEGKVETPPHLSVGVDANERIVTLDTPRVSSQITERKAHKASVRELSSKNRDFPEKGSPNQSSNGTNSSLSVSSSYQTSLPLPSHRSANEQVGGAEAIDPSAPVTSPLAPRLSPRLQHSNKHDGKPIKSISAPGASLPQSRSPTCSDENEESIFGPFVEPVVGTEWNPFADGLPSGEVFNVIDDDRSDTYHHRKDSTTSLHAIEAELDGLRRIFDSEYERALEDQEVAWKARYAATRWSFILSAMCMVFYLWLGCMFYRSEAGWSVPDALLFTVYTVTTVGYGGPQPLPNTAAFHAFTSMYVLVGIAGVTVLGAHTYQLVMLEATRIRSSPLQQRRARTRNGQDSSGSAQHDEEDDSGMARRRRQFMNELEERVREQPLLDVALDYCIDRFKEFRIYLQLTKSGRALGVALPFLGLILLGAAVVGPIEGWTPLESIYWSIVTLTTVGYGDYVPAENASVWFCTLFFIPSSLFFLSFFLAHVAKSYIRLHAIHVTQLERRMRLKIEKHRSEVKRAAQAKANSEAIADDLNLSTADDLSGRSSSAVSSRAEDVESGFTTLSYTEDEDLANGGRNGNGIGFPGNSAQLFGDATGIGVDPEQNNVSNSLTSGDSPGLRYRENVIRNKLVTPDPDGCRAVSFAEALQSLNHSLHSQMPEEKACEEQTTANEALAKEDQNKPSLDIRLRVQERLARIIAEEVAGFQTGVAIKGSTVSVTIGSLRETAEKWRIPPHAWKAFRAVAFRSLLFVGERDLISEGGDALLRLNAIEFHGIFSPMLAAMGDGRSMESWLAGTDVLADVELRREPTEAIKDTLARDKKASRGTFT